MRAGFLKNPLLKDLIVVSALTAPGLALALPSHDMEVWFQQPLYSFLAMGVSAFMTAGAWLWFTRPMKVERETRANPINRGSRNNWGYRNNRNNRTNQESTSLNLYNRFNSPDSLMQPVRISDFPRHYPAAKKRLY